MWGLYQAGGLASIDAFQFGFAIGVLNVPQEAIAETLHLDPNGITWSTVVSIFCLGGLAGAQVAGSIADRYGRTSLLMVSALLCAVSGAVQFLSGAIASEHDGGDALLLAICALCFGRLLVGAGAGMATVGVPLYLGEIAPAHLRGLFGALNQVAIVFGILVSQLIAALAAESLHWKYLLGLPALGGVLVLLARPLLPETPMYLLTSLTGEDDALRSLRRLRPNGEKAIADELEALRADIESVGSTTGASSLRAVFADPSLRLPLFVAFSMMVGSQWSGINAIFFYSTSFFAEAGLNDPVVGTLLASAVNALAMLAACPLIETAGRRRLLLVGVSGMLVTAVVLTVVLVLKEACAVKGACKLLDASSVVCVLLFVTFFEFGPGPIPWQIGAEIFPETPRATAMGAAAALNWLCNGAIGLLFPPMQVVLGAWVFVPFAVVLAAWLAVTLRYTPETKGKSIAQIQMEFARIAGGEVHLPLKDVTAL